MTCVVHRTPDDPPVPLPPVLRLTEEQIALLRREGQVRRVTAGEVLFAEGDRGYDFIVILSGLVAIVDHEAKTERVLTTGGPGQFVAELACLSSPRGTGSLTPGWTLTPIQRRASCSPTTIRR
jgi:CRP-like cAMP-binding protein